LRKTSPPLLPLENCANGKEEKEKEKRDEAFDPFFKENLFKSAVKS
jgi:hypothetical protein